MNKIAITILAALISMSAMSQEADAVDRSGFYLGGKFGQVDIEGDLKTNAWGVHGGYTLNQYVSAEIAYISAVEYHERDVGIELDGIQFAIIPTLPINDDWSVTARLGYARLKGSYDNYNFSDSDYFTEYTYGVGVVRHIGQTFVRLEYEVIDDSDFISLGFGVRF